jgi:GxxExxY protein
MTLESRDPRTFAILGAAFEVHRHLGHGFLEAVYQDALEAEFSSRGIPFRREVELLVLYKGQPLATSYRADFVCHESIIVELKAIEAVGDSQIAQVLNYLKATGFGLGLLLNFGTPSLEYRRLIRSQQKPEP